MCTACTDQKESIAEEETVLTASTGVQWAESMARDTFNLRHVRPSALLGVFVTDYLTQVSGIHTALRGIEAYVIMRGDTDHERGEDFALLETLGHALQTDVPDLLNRSPVRAHAFDNYVTALSDLLRRASARVERLKQELAAFNDQRREQRRQTATIQRELNTALRSEQYALASEIQQRLQQAETARADIEAREGTQRGLIRLYEKLMLQGERRIIAMGENREVLIAGLKVVDVPGIEPLGILEEGDTRALRRTGSPYEYLFDGL